MNYITLEHQPVLLKETIENLSINKDGFYVDATFGRGGHSKEILSHLSAKGRLLIIDKDLSAIMKAESIGDSRITAIHSSFANLKQIVEKIGWQQKINGILLDLGVSSPQLDEAARGFSFLKDGPLDMRMNIKQQLTAEKWLSSAKESEIAEVIKKYGEERFSKRIARAIVAERNKKPIKTTGELSAIVMRANPHWEKSKHPATRVFQALRIFINDELEELKECLEQALEVLAPAGRLLVISFHSLEERIVKDFVKRNSGGSLPRGLPITDAQLNKRLFCVKRGIKATPDEITHNMRARSAKLTVMEKIK